MSKRLRMLVALATVAAMMLSLAGIASAQFSDVDEDASYADAVELLADLKIAQGYPDGSFGVDNPMTRQEFAVFVVRAMGREALANSFANFQTSFSDDAQIGAWARGHVYLATNSRIINGYPDGTFRPNGHVTQAEALTMLVRALGFGDYADKLGTWPTGYLLAADELGLTDGLNVVSGLPMTRSEMAIALKNALVVSKTLDDGKLTDVANGEASWLRKAHKYTASQYREVAGDTSKVAGVFERFRAGERVELEDGRIYNLADNPEMSFNNGAPAALNKNDIERGDRVTLHLNADDEVTEIAVFRYDVEGVLTDVSLQSGEEEYGSISVQGHTYAAIDVDADTKIFVDGDAMILAELDDEDVVNEAFVRVATEDEAGDYAVEIQVYTNTVRGKVERLGRDSGGRYVILDVDGDDEKYYYANNVTPTVGSRATFILDDEDVIVATATVTPATTEYFAILVGETSNAWIFERGNGSEFELSKTAGWTVPTNLEVGVVYDINEANEEVSEVDLDDARYNGNLLTVADDYIRVNDGGPKRVSLADDVIVEIDGDPFESADNLQTGQEVWVFAIEDEGIWFAVYIVQE